MLNFIYIYHQLDKHSNMTVKKEMLVKIVEQQKQVADFREGKNKHFDLKDMKFCNEINVSLFHSLFFAIFLDLVDD